MCIKKLGNYPKLHIVVPSILSVWIKLTVSIRDQPTNAYKASRKCGFRLIDTECVRRNVYTMFIMHLYQL